MSYWVRFDGDGYIHRVVNEQPANTEGWIEVDSDLLIGGGKRYLLEHADEPDGGWDEKDDVLGVFYPEDE